MECTCYMAQGWGTIFGKWRETMLRMRRYFFLLFLFVPTAFSVQFSAPSCSKQYLGKVREVQPPKGAVHAFSKNTVIFDVVKKVKGEVSGEERIELLKFGPVSVEVGEVYEVQQESGSVCYIAKAQF